ncbi:MAG: response regulator transcription factor [Chitinophagaceae bacterium]|jgi:DNA-binding NarL/FixJ family response regulator|uniref:response regulator n=1 Tax=Sediminibacterium sp. TaxID=1917865 RepID=UPI001BC06283|nr:response regulator transcription factor [Chitinophagaceae bacterium]
MTKIMICDDHPIFRKGLIKILENNDKLSVIFEASSGNEVITALENGIQPDILLFDIHMPLGINGYQLAKYVGRKFSQIKMVCISFFAEKINIDSMYRLGVVAFISKDDISEKLFGVINRLNEDNSYNDTIGLKNADKQNNNQKNTISILDLTARELEAAILMSSDKPYKEIASQMKISPNTLENIRVRIFRKTNTKSRTDLAILLLKAGLLT